MLPQEIDYGKLKYVIMNKISFAAGADMGTIVGATVGMILDPIKDKQNKEMKRTAGKAFRNLGSVIDGVLDMRF